MVYRCANGTGPSVSTVGSQCVQCNAVNSLFYILLRYLPATIIFLFILIAQIDVTSAPMAHYILYCNAVVMYFRSSLGFLKNSGYRHTIHRNVNNTLSIFSTGVSLCSN